MQTLEELNSKFGISESVIFEPGEGGFIKALLRHKNGAQAEAYLYGAHLTSWQSREFTEVFFLSAKADFKEGKAIRGGIPLVFPQFGKGSLPSHGFARTSLWTVQETALGANDEVRITFALTDNEKTFSIWPYKFKLEFEVTLSESLATVMRIFNLDQKAFSFQNALHTYFQVGDIGRSAVLSLKGLSYLDNLKNRESAADSRERVTFDGELDRIYQNAPHKVEIDDAAQKRAITIEKTNFKDAVVWNPAESGSKPIGDLQESDYLKFVCVESANTFPVKELAAGQVFEGAQVLKVTY